jgi:hypothetical protein
MLQLDRTPTHSRQWITFAATDLVDDAVASNRNQLKVQVFFTADFINFFVKFTRNNIPILAPKTLKIHSPFLLVFTQQSMDNAGDSRQETHRSKRSVDAYYQVTFRWF